MTISYHLSPSLTNEALNELFRTAWTNHTATDFAPILSHSLFYVAALDEAKLVGFVNVAWDGGIHAFLLDTTVHAQYQRLGIGAQLVHHAAETARSKGIQWLHVDYEPHLDHFYQSCGFKPTLAGLLDLG